MSHHKTKDRKIILPFLCFVIIPSTPPLKVISMSEMSICFHYLVTCLLFMFISMLYLFFGEGNGTPLQYSCLENPMDGGAW